MNFDILQFIRTNKVLFIWGLFFALVYLARAYGLFGLVFITFILCFTFNNVIVWLCSAPASPAWCGPSPSMWSFWPWFYHPVLRAAQAGLRDHILRAQAPEMMDKVFRFLDKMAVQSPDMAARWAASSDTWPENIVGLTWRPCSTWSSPVQPGHQLRVLFPSGHAFQLPHPARLSQAAPPDQALRHSGSRISTRSWPTAWPSSP
jgi:hypothetical protein